MNKLEDMLDRFEGLLNRFEGSEGATAGSSATGGASGATKTKKVKQHQAVKDFETIVTPLIEKFSGAGKAHPNEKIQKATVHVVEKFNTIRNLIHAVTISKQTKSEDLSAVVAPIMKDFDMKIGKTLKGLDLKNHQKALIDGLQLIQLVMVEDPTDYGKEFLAQIDFFGNKILTGDKKEDADWYRVYRTELCQGFVNYMYESYEGGIPFKFDGTDFKDNFTTLQSGGAAASTAAPAKEEAPKEEKKAAKPAAKPKTAPKRKPEKTKRGKMWDILFYEGETLEFSGDDVSKDTSFMVTGCTKTNIIIKGKFNNITLTNCKNCAVVIDTCISSVEIIKGDDVKLQVNEKCSQVAVDRSIRTGLYLCESSKDVKVMTTCSTSTFLHFDTKEQDALGNDEASLGVPESYVTKIVNDKLVTEPVDLTD